eukprot:TRINITY_DN16012_c0_g1_i1.p1 TRINITY_DN16012_c0_g1~~TRINITY_DN16012_c0_g1_i1.p1  ORF type:complete len:425 (-),score=109.49 TRINITY_DN16012_c0_g1_i1:100-1374(-)
MATFSAPVPGLSTVMIKRRVPDDNDCLFSSLAYLTSTNGSYTPAGNAQLRRDCAEAVAADPITFCEPVLGMSPEAYKQWITNKFNWGGETEIVVLCKKFEIELGIVSMESFTTLVYGQADAPRPRGYVLYTGQHYEPFVEAPSAEATAEVETRLFPATGDGDRAARFSAIEAACLVIARDFAEYKAKQKAVKKKKVLKCGGCGALCDDNEAFQAHCMEVEHDDDFMYDCSEVEVVLDESDACAINLESPDTKAIYNSATECLSNRALGFAIKVNGVEYPSAYHFWHCARYAGVEALSTGTASALAPDVAALVSKIRSAPTVEDAERISNFEAGDCRDSDGWKAPGGRESDGRRRAAEVATLAKFEQHAAAREALLATRGKTLVVLDTDTWAGVDNCGGYPKGRNVLGEVLRDVREELLRQSGTA